MGQDVSRKCACSGFCSTQDPATEASAELMSRGGQAPIAAHLAQQEESIFGISRPKHAGREDRGDEDTYVPAPPPEIEDPSAQLAPAGARKKRPEDRPAVPSTPDPPRRSISPSTSSMAGGGQATASPAPAGDIRSVLADVPAAEAAAWRGAFENVAGGRSTLQLDCAPLRELILRYSGIAEADLDTELLKIASRRDDFDLDADSFAALLRDNPVNEGEVLEQFISLSANGDTIDAEECRSGILDVLRSKLDAQIEADQIVDVAMSEAGLVVSMEQWTHYCKLASRIVHVARYFQAATTEERCHAL